MIVTYVSLVMRSKNRTLLFECASYRIVLYVISAILSVSGASNVP